MEGRYSLYKLLQDGELDEADVWAVYEERKGAPNAARKIPRGRTHETKIGQQYSVPVNIPDWSKIYAKTINLEKDSCLDDYDNGEYYDDEDGDYKKVPPHEWIAKRVAVSETCSKSMFEGVGRTLKGRDLSKVRNAVLTKTGFIE